MRPNREAGHQMLRHVRSEINKSYHRRDAFKKMYLEEPDGCIHEDLLGEELVRDLKNKFYWPMDAIRRQLWADLGPDHPMFVFVDPSSEDSTHVFLTLDDREVLVSYSCNAWKFWFEDESQMKRELREWYEIARQRYKETEARRRQEFRGPSSGQTKLARRG